MTGVNDMDARESHTPIPRDNDDYQQPELLMLCQKACFAFTFFFFPSFILPIYSFLLTAFVIVYLAPSFLFFDFPALPDLELFFSFLFFGNK